MAIEYRDQGEAIRAVKRQPVSAEGCPKNLSEIGSAPSSRNGLPRASPGRARRVPRAGGPSGDQTLGGAGVGCTGLPSGRGGHQKDGAALGTGNATVARVALEMRASAGVDQVSS